MPAYLPYPRFLLKMDISHTAKMLYALLLDRDVYKRQVSDIEHIADTVLMMKAGQIVFNGSADEIDDLEKFYLDEFEEE